MKDVVAVLVFGWPGDWLGMSWVCTTFLRPPAFGIISLLCVVGVGVANGLFLYFFFLVSFGGRVQ